MSHLEFCRVRSLESLGKILKMTGSLSALSTEVALMYSRLLVMIPVELCLGLNGQKPSALSIVSMMTVKLSACETKKVRYSYLKIKPNSFLAQKNSIILFLAFSKYPLSLCSSFILFCDVGRGVYFIFILFSSKCIPLTIPKCNL